MLETYQGKIYLNMVAVLKFGEQLVAEMVVPEVNKEALAELEAMGFPTARSTRALHFSGARLFLGIL
jgi:hypothetical protein